MSVQSIQPIKRIILPKSNAIKKNAGKFVPVKDMKLTSQVLSEIIEKSSLVTKKASDKAKTAIVRIGNDYSSPEWCW